MSNKPNTLETLGRTFLKSTSHIRVRDEKGSYIRSVLVGLQFSVIHFPGEIFTVALVPFVSNILADIYELGANLLFVIRGAVEALYLGFAGHLEASDEPLESVEGDDVK